MGVSRGASRGVAAREGASDAARLRAICEGAPLAIVAVDLRDRVTLWSPGAERMFAWTERELLGQPLPVSLEGAAEDFELVREALRSARQLVDHEIVRRAADGGRIVTSVSTVPLYDAEGELIETIAVIVDLTDQRRTNRGSTRAKSGSTPRSRTCWTPTASSRRSATTRDGSSTSQSSSRTRGASPCWWKGASR